MRVADGMCLSLAAPKIVDEWHRLFFAGIMKTLHINTGMRIQSPIDICIDPRTVKSKDHTGLATLGCIYIYISFINALECRLTSISIELMVGRILRLQI